MAKTNYYEHKPWPGRANKHRTESIDHAGEVKVVGDKALKLVEQALKNCDDRLYQLLPMNLREIRGQVQLTIKAAELIQTLLENAPSGDEPADQSIWDEIAEIKARLDQLEQQSQGKLRIAR